MNNKILSFIAIFFVFSLIVLGGVVHNTQSSLACPDWPLCYGNIFPKMTGGVLIEHSHRLLASFVGFLTILLVIMGYLNFKKDKENKKLRRIFIISCFSLFFVILQGVLGGITVIYRLPTIVSTFHLALSMVFLLTLIYLNHLISFLDNKNDKIIKLIHKNEWKLPHSSFILLITVFIFSQLLLGAFIRHSGAGVACGLGLKNAFMCLDQSSWLSTFFPSNSMSKVHMLHRFWGIFIFIFAHIGFVKLISKTSSEHKQMPLLKTIKLLSLVVLSALTIQVILGILTVATNIGIITTAAHLAFAAIILALSFKLYLILKTIEDQLLDFEYFSFLSDLFIMMKPKLCFLILTTVLAGMFIGVGRVDFFTALFTIFFTALLAWGAAILNCYIERDVDALMDRTKNRPLPSRRFSNSKALWIGLLFSIVGFGCLIIFVNTLTALLGLLASLIYLFIYTPLKRRSSSFLLIGAIVGAIPPVLGSVSVTGNFSSLNTILFLILFVWQIPHFIALSIYYESDYLNADIKTLPLQIGQNISISLIAFSTLLLLIVSLLPSYLKLNDQVYFYWTLLLGLSLFMFAIWGKFTKNKKNWSYRYFVGTIIYLPLCLLGLLFFK